MIKMINNKFKPKNLKEQRDLLRIHWWSLPIGTCLYLNNFPKEIKKRGKYVTVKKLLKVFGRKDSLDRLIKIVRISIRENRQISIKFPINLNNLNYVKLYALMSSEGSYKTEFKIHVPETIFHNIFKKTLASIFSKEIIRYIKMYERNGAIVSRAPGIVRYLVPIPEKIPNIIFKNKGYAKEYLKIAFEAEGSPMLKGNKRYIKLSRNCNISEFKDSISIPKEKRVYLGTLKEKYPKFVKKISKLPPSLLLGESSMLKTLFNIDNIIKLEAIRSNKTEFRRGKLSARWVLFIYADNINRFIEKIGFISKRKSKICKKMMKINARKQQFFALNLINKIQKNYFFTRNEFFREMERLGYKSPQAFLWRYEKKGLIKRIKEGHYRIISRPTLPF